MSSVLLGRGLRREIYVAPDGRAPKPRSMPLGA
eukprot:CAMPEP_0168694800 /NCGR_PEP_ID=MMETSP0503-20121227/34490_1 /TAXON_ID=89963 /ORGANISM="Heterocapsa rotundata, Strain SCCAP K-0483" /LENGTH=32 /DNA_ID= /DNA_START= /DNA_END= /DNA_ORIENTATION=